MVVEAFSICLCLLCVFLMSGVWGQKVVTYGILSLFLVLLVLGFKRAFLSIFEMDVIIGAISLREQPLAIKCDASSAALFRKYSFWLQMRRRRNVWP